MQANPPPQNRFQANYFSGHFGCGQRPISSPQNHASAVASAPLRTRLPVPSSRMRSMRRSGSAAPQSNWSPTVNAARYCGPIAQLAQPADGHLQRAGDRGRRELARCSPPARSAPRCTHWLASGEHRLDLGERHVARELDRQRLAVAAHRADAHADAVDRDRRLRRGRGSCCPRPAPSTPRGSGRCRGPCRSTASRLPASGTPKCSVGMRVGAQRTRPRAGRSREWPRPDRRAARPRRRAPRPSARAARACSARRRRRRPGRSSPSSTRPAPCLKRPCMPMSIRLTVQLPPM